MNANSLWKETPPRDSARAVQDQWGLYDPQQAGPSTTPGQCRFCTETLSAGAQYCPLCLRAVSDSAAAPSAPPAQMPPSPAAAQLSGRTNGAAVYTLEAPAQCPECDKEISTIHVLRVLRTQVSFTSTLPRKAYVIACPECRRLLSAGLSGLV